MNGRPRALVVGGRGVLGSITVDVFGNRGWEVVRGVRRPGRSRGAVVVDVDAEPQLIAEAVGSVDVVINTVPHGFAVEQAALQCGGRVLNVAATEFARQRELRNRHGMSAVGTVLLNAGWAPGVTHLVVADMLARFPEADSIETAASLSYAATSGREGIKLVYDSMTNSGRHGSYSGIHFVADIPFRQPVGKRTCIGFLERERCWVGRQADQRKVSAYCYFDNAALRRFVLAMNRIRLLDSIPMGPFMIGRRSAPQSPSAESVVHWVSVLREGKRLESRTIECRGRYRTAARATEVMARAMLDNSTARRAGCFDPDELFSIAGLNGSLEDVGILVRDIDKSGWDGRVTGLLPDEPETYRSSSLGGSLGVQ